MQKTLQKTCIYVWFALSLQPEKDETDKSERMVSIKRPLLRYLVSESGVRRKTVQRFA